MPSRITILCTLYTANNIFKLSSQGGSSLFVTSMFPEIGCPYIPPDQCTGFTPAPCCERIKDGDGDGDGGVDDGAGVIVKTSMALLLVLAALAALL